MEVELREPAAFDCRLLTFDTFEEVEGYLRWREADAVRNSVSMAAQHYYSHGELFNKSREERLDLLAVVGIQFQAYPARFKYGAYFKREEITRTFTAGEIELLPEKHNARKNPNMTFTRSIISRVYENGLNEGELEL